MAGFLSEREREELRMAHRCESQVRYTDRIKAVLLLDAGWPANKISEALYFSMAIRLEGIKSYIWQTG